MKIVDYPSTTKIKENDVLLIDGTNGTRQISAAHLSNEIVKMDGQVEELTERINTDVPFKFGIDEDGNYGYYKRGADTVTPFKSGSGLIYVGTYGAAPISNNVDTFTISLPEDIKKVAKSVNEFVAVPIDVNAIKDYNGILTMAGSQARFPVIKSLANGVLTVVRAGVLMANRETGSFLGGTQVNFGLYFLPNGNFFSTSN